MSNNVSIITIIQKKLEVATVSPMLRLNASVGWTYYSSAVILFDKCNENSWNCIYEMFSEEWVKATQNPSEYNMFIAIANCSRFICYVSSTRIAI